MLRVPCNLCGESIHPDTAAKNGGLCMPCHGGYRERIEDGKRSRETEKAYKSSAEHQYWISLSSKVHGVHNGFNVLSPNEQTYFALGCLVGEVYNGGLHQFFFNSSGSMYGAALNGLYELEAHETAGLLSGAKELLFGSPPVPMDTGERRRLMQARNAPAELEQLDSAFWKDTEKLGERCKKYAHEHQLYRDA